MDQVYGSGFFTKKNIIALLIMGVLVLAIPIGLKLAQKQQQLKSRASGGQAGITFTGPNVSCDSGGSCTTKSASVEVDLVSPDGLPPAVVSPTATPTPATPTPTPGS